MNSTHFFKINLFQNGPKAMRDLVLDDGRLKLRIHHKGLQPSFNGELHGEERTSLWRGATVCGLEEREKERESPYTRRRGCLSRKEEKGLVTFLVLLSLKRSVPLGTLTFIKF